MVCVYCVYINLAAQTLQSGNTNSQQCAGVKDYPLVSHVCQLGDPELATQMCQSGSKPALAAQTLQSGNTNSQQRAGVNGNPLVSHLDQLQLGIYNPLVSHVSMPVGKL